MLGKYSTSSNTRPATTHIYAMRTYFSPWQTSTANVTKPFLRKPAHPVRLNYGTLQNLLSCFHTSRFKSITSIHCQRPLQKHVNNHIEDVNGLTFVPVSTCPLRDLFFLLVFSVAKMSFLGFDNAALNNCLFEVSKFFFQIIIC